jgi:hypothetical protein
VKRILVDKRPARLMTECLALMGIIAALAITVAACTDLMDTGSTVTGAPGTTVLKTTTLSSTSESTTTSAPTLTTTTTMVSVSEESKAYAESLGGTDRYGEELWFVIGQGALSSEAQAKTLLEPAKVVGQEQMYFIVQLSDNFDGMTPGYWIIFEAYDDYPPPEDIEWCRRVFPDAYVKSAIVMTHDPIPVR